MHLLMLIFCTMRFIIKAQGNDIEEIFHGNSAWDFNNADSRTEEYSFILLKAKCNITYKIKTLSFPGDFRPKMKTLLVANCTASENCKEVKAQVKIPDERYDRTPSTFTYVTGCIPNEAEDFLIRSNSIIILVIISVVCNVLFLGGYIRSQYNISCDSLPSKLFPWQAGAYNVNTNAGHSMTAQPSNVLNATRQADYGTRSVEVDNVDTIQGHSMTGQHSNVSSTRSADADNINTITEHSVTGQSPEVASTAQQVEDDTRTGGYNGNTTAEHSISAQTFQDGTTTQQAEDDTISMK